MMIKPGDAVYLGDDGLIRPHSGRLGELSSLLGFATNRVTDSITKVWVRTPGVDEERLYKLGCGHWLDIWDEPLIDAIELYLEHR